MSNCHHLDIVDPWVQTLTKCLDEPEIACHVSLKLGTAALMVWLCSKLLQLVAPESLDLRAVNAPPDSTAWVQLSRPTTPDLLSNPESAAAAPSHTPAQPSEQGLAEPDIPPAAVEDGSLPLSSLQDQEAMREALERSSMPGPDSLPTAPGSLQVPMLHRRNVTRRCWPVWQASSLTCTLTRHERFNWPSKIGTPG